MRCSAYGHLFFSFLSVTKSSSKAIQLHEECIAPGLPVCTGRAGIQFRSLDPHMDSDRKYRQNGYYDSGSSSRNGNRQSERPKPSGPRPPIDITGPRLPRLVQAVTASRCYSCSTTLPQGTSFNAPCPKCGTALHCCKQCSHFEPSTRFQCMKPVPLRIPLKDQANECALFSPRVTVAREATNSQQASGNGAGRPAPTMNTPPPRNAGDARDAFERLFRK